MTLDRRSDPLIANTSVEHAPHSLNVRIAINGSLPQKTARRPQSRLAMQCQPWAASTKTEALPAGSVVDGSCDTY